ncbi:MAG: ABC transporter permease [Gallionellaceae bacterium]|nr:MAG: ABC transporter permease [Gallionellaceae bacterium]
MIFTIAHKEFRSLFATPSTWLILAALQFLFAWFFLARLDAYLQVQAQLALIANAPGATLSVAAALFGTLALMLMMLIPLFSMRLLAEERRNQTLALLLAAPVSSSQIVLGKFLSLVLFVALIIASCTAMLCLLGLGTHLDFGLLAANASGLLLLAASYAALGLYLSALTKQPIVAATGATALSFGLWLLDVGGTDSSLRALSPSAHAQSLNAGLILSADLLYFILFIATFLLLTIRRLDNNRLYA